MFLRVVFCFVLTLIQQVPVQMMAAPLAMTVAADSAILINADTGMILYEKNANTLQYPASITKVATAAYALRVAGDKLDTVVVAEQDAVVSVTEEAKRNSNYTVPAYWLIPGGSHIGIKKGEALSLRDLLYGLMVASGNDAANVIAQHVGGTIPKFMESLNVYLKEIGCKNTTFYNPHGLFHPKHQTTAFDMAQMLRDALKDKTFREIVKTVNYTRPKTNKQAATVLLQTNKLMRKGKYYYSKAIGGKTGYLSVAGHTLVVAAEQDNRILIAVLMNSKDRNELFLDAIKMFETAFKQPKIQRVLVKKGPQKYALELQGASKAIATYIRDDISMEYYPAEEAKVKCMLYWNSVKPPIAKDQVIGELRLMTSEGVVLQTVPVLAQEDVATTWSFWLRNLF